VLSASGREFGRIVAAAVLVTGAAAVTLRGVDSLPAIFLGEPRGIVRHASVEAAEKALGTTVLLPSYFPDSLRWPATSVRSGRVPAPGLGVQFTGRDGGRERLFLFETMPGGSEFPASLVPEANPYHSVPVRVGDARGVFRSVRLSSEGNFSEVDFRKENRRILIRYAGTGDELMKIAGSLR
jgi:hypothetical protein